MTLKVLMAHKLQLSCVSCTGDLKGPRRRFPDGRWRQLAMLVLELLTGTSQFLKWLKLSVKERAGEDTFWFYFFLYLALYSFTCRKVSV